MTTIVDVRARAEGAACTLEGTDIVPRLIRRRGNEVEVALVAGQALLLPGDDVEIRVEVGEGCVLRLIDVGGLIVQGRSAARSIESRWRTHVHVDTDAHLEWRSLPTVVTAAASLVRSTVVALGLGATAVLRETLVFGRAGEQGGSIVSRTEVADLFGPLLHEVLTADGRAPSPGILGTCRVMDTLLAVGDGAMLPETAGATRFALDRDGWMLRHLGVAAHDSPLDRVAIPAWNSAPRGRSDPSIASMTAVDTYMSTSTPTANRSTT